MLWLVSAMVLGQAAEPPALPAALEKSVRHATVRIYNSVEDCGGSGIVIERSGTITYVLTAAHVVEKAERVEVHLFDPEQPSARPRVFEAAVVIARTSPNAEDLALLRIAAEADAFPFAIAIRKKGAALPKTPASAFSVGCAEGHRPIVLAETALGAVALRKAGGDASARFWKCQKRPAPQRSGGALLHPDGTLLGVCSGEDGKAGYYSHLDEIRRFLKRNGLGSLAE